MKTITTDIKISDYGPTWVTWLEHMMLNIHVQ